jgi:DNA-binding NarL/FixJ family response regulator
VKVLLVDDNRLMLEGLQNLLEAHSIEVAGQAKDGHQALTLARELKPNIILMDIRMPGCDGLTATRLIKAEMPDMKIVILTTSTEDQDLFEAVKSGACGYLLKSMDSGELMEAIDQAQQGIPPFSPGLAAKLLREFTRLSQPSAEAPPVSSSRSGEVTPVSDLNVRQVEVLTLIAQGLSYKEAGARLNLSASTVRYHIAEIIRRLHLENRAQVLAFAGRLNSEYDQRPK